LIRTRLITRWRAAGAIAIAAALGACSSSASRSATPVLAPTTAETISTTITSGRAAPDRALAGPQGGVGQFVVECDYSHAAPNDPIVKPGRPGASHLHAFFGNTSTDANSTAESLGAAMTTCNQSLDRASYWVPALLADGVPVKPVKSTAYYRAGLGVDPKSVQPYPFGLKIVAGEAHPAAPQSLAVVAWSCGAGIRRDVTPTACPSSRNLRMLVTFPDCWNGVDLDSADHRSHMSYSSAGECSSTHPTPVPQLQFSVEFAVSGDPSNLGLSSGGLGSGHADFFNAWDPDRLAREVKNCLHRNAVCGVASGRTTG
jgi:Domain of unknown function (DUF1996)